MKILLIALGVVFLFWIISLLIKLGDRKTREKKIQEHQLEKIKKEKEEEEAEKPPWG